MRKSFSLSLLIATMLIGTQAVAGNFKDAKTVFKSGNWKVLHATDAMTDNTTCTGIYKENYGIQLVQNRLFVTVRGGIRGVTLRFGDNPPRKLRLADKMEKDIGAVIISGGDFSELLQSNRLRVQILTFSDIEEVDLDTTGIQAAVENIQAGCPIQADFSENQVAATPASQTAPESACSPALIAKMKAAGVKEAQVRNICKAP
jgi:hypothetical protein